MLKGLNLDATIALADAVSIPVIASGGLASHRRCARVARAARAQKLAGAIAGRALYDGRLDAAAALEADPHGAGGVTMFKVRVIPCLDVKDGRVVKGVNFVNLRDAGDPVEAAIAYDEAGADELTFLDITASHEDRGIMLDVVRRTAEACFMPLTVGGGVRTIEDIRTLLASGADKVSINTAAVARRAFVKEAAEKFGDQCIVVAIDAKKVSKAGESGPLGNLHPWRPPADRHRRARLCAAKWSRSAPAKSCSPPWTATAPGRALTSRSPAPSPTAVPVPVIASGGVGTLDHLVEGVRDGHASAVLAASIFHFGEHSVREAKAVHGARRPAECGSILKTPSGTCFAQASACSSRSLPQNSSPSAVEKLGAPNRPSRCASSVSARSRVLDRRRTARPRAPPTARR